MVHPALSTLQRANARNIPLPANRDWRGKDGDWRYEDVLHQSLVKARELNDDIMIDAGAPAEMSSKIAT